jgi:hypothetical protein
MKQETKVIVSFIFFVGIVGMLLGVVVARIVRPSTTTLQTVEYNHVSKLVQTGLTMIKDFYEQDKLLLSYSIDGIPQTVFLDQPFEETLPKYQAYLRELGDFSILGDE